MCLFTTNPMTQCKHVQCSIIKTIQLQNPQIFPHLIVNNNHQTIIQQQQYEQSYIPSIAADHCSIDHIPMNNNNMSNSIVVQQSQHMDMDNQYKQIKEQHIRIQLQLQPKLNHNIGQLSEQHSISHNFVQQNQQKPLHFQPSNSSLSTYRISMLQKQVSILKNSMITLISQLKQKHILNQQEYSIQQNILKQIQHLQQLAQKQYQHDQQQHRRNNDNNQQ